MNIRIMPLAESVSREPGVMPVTGRDRIIVRKKPGSELLNISAATKILGLTPRMLKSLIPCSETRIAEEDGVKSIKEYYWDKALVGRLESLWIKSLEGRGYNSEDLAFIAENCCAGDRRWAHDCISSFLHQRKLSAVSLADTETTYPL